MCPPRSELLAPSPSRSPGFWQIDPAPGVPGWPRRPGPAAVSVQTEDELFVRSVLRCVCVCSLLPLLCVFFPQKPGACQDQPLLSRPESLGNELVPNRPAGSRGTPALRPPTVCPDSCVHSGHVWVPLRLPRSEASSSGRAPAVSRRPGSTARSLVAGASAPEPETRRPVEW